MLAVAGSSGTVLVGPAGAQIVASAQESVAATRAVLGGSEPPGLVGDEGAPLVPAPRVLPPADDGVWAAVRPHWIQIPVIDVDARVEHVGLDADGALVVPYSDRAGWWSGGVPPGGPGPAVVVGHVDSFSGSGVFADLDQLADGDLIAIGTEAGAEVRFVVDRVERHDKDEFPTNAVYGFDVDEPRSGLRLITCGGAFDPLTRTFEENIIVFASPVGG